MTIQGFSQVQTPAAKEDTRLKSQDAVAARSPAPASSMNSAATNQGLNSLQDTQAERLKLRSKQVLAALNSKTLPQEILAKDFCFSIPRLGLGETASKNPLAAAFPDLQLRTEENFFDSRGGVALSSVVFSGTFSNKLGALPANGRVVTFKAFVETRLNESGEVQAVNFHLDPALLFHAMGYLPNPASKVGRLRIIMRKSKSAALKIVLNTAWTAVRKLWQKKPAIPNLDFIPPPPGASVLDIIKRHFDFENAHDAQGTTQTMSAGAVARKNDGIGLTLATRSAVYSDYQAAFVAFNDAVFSAQTMALSENDGRRVIVLYDFKGHHTSDASGIPATGKEITYSAAPVVFDVDAKGGVSSEDSNFSVLDLLVPMGLAFDPRTEEGLNQLLKLKGREKKQRLTFGH